MSLALIQETAKEVRRLAIAGSPLAVGDFRLKKFIQPLEQAGAKVPVFAQVAKGIRDLVEGKEADSPALLLSLSTLLNAILYTQGQTGVAGDFRLLELYATDGASTRTSARVLKPIIDALTSTGSGRFEVVKEAVQRGSFRDLRLIEPALRALDDSYADLADLVADKILPAYGPGLAPLLKLKLDLKGKKADARRLSILHRLDPAGTVALCKTALEDGSVEVKLAALACLGQHEDCLPLVQEQVNAKNKQLRVAALAALAPYDRPEITRLFTDLIGGHTLDFLARPFRAIRNRFVLQSLLSEGTRVLDAVIKGDEAALLRYAEVLDCLEGRTDAEVEDFLVASFSHGGQLAKLKAPKTSAISGTDLLGRLVSLLYLLGSPNALNAVLAQRHLQPSSSFNHVLYCALRAWPPDRVYDEFSPLLEAKKGAGKEKLDLLQHALRATCQGYVSVYESTDDEAAPAEAQWLHRVAWDPRWLPASIHADQPVIVCCLAQPETPDAVAYLASQLKAKSPPEPGLLIKTLARCRYPQVTDAFLELVARRVKTTRYYDYDLQWLLDSARFLPPADLPRLDAFATQLDEKFLDRFLEALAPLRPTAQPESATQPAPA